jgi:hypothetical protein
MTQHRHDQSSLYAHIRQALTEAHRCEHQSNLSEPIKQENLKLTEGQLSFDN